MKKLILLAAIGLWTPALLAGGGHFHPKKVAKCTAECTADQLKAALPEAINHLSKWGKIDASWKTAKVTDVSKKTFSKGPEWVLTLDNAGKKHYVFITLDGFVAGANDTGD
ncbi:MAG: DUF6488 family protein [Bdellovibrionota bacterium]